MQNKHSRIDEKENRLSLWLHWVCYTSRSLVFVPSVISPALFVSSTSSISPSWQLPWPPWSVFCWQEKRLRRCLPQMLVASEMHCSLPPGVGRVSGWLKAQVLHHLWRWKEETVIIPELKLLVDSPFGSRLWLAVVFRRHDIGQGSSIRHLGRPWLLTRAWRWVQFLPIILW